MSRPTPIIPKSPRLFKFVRPLPSVGHITVVCDEIVRELHELLELQAEAARRRHVLEVQDVNMRNHRVCMYYAAFRHFERCATALSEKIEKALLADIDGLRAAFKRHGGLSLEEIVQYAFEAERPRVEQDIRDFRTNVPVLMEFRSNCLTVFYQILHADNLPGPAELIKGAQSLEEKMRILDDMIAHCVSDAHREYLRSERRGRAADVV